jgi:phospholipid/cholesterol/gamma-HCH transport system substrate-binding protein
VSALAQATRRTAVRLALFTVLCLAMTFWLAVTIGNLHPFQKTYPVSATFDDVTGLLPGDNVKIAGVVVGRVSSVKLVQGLAVVRFVVNNGVKLPADSEAAIRWRNLLGQRYLYLYPGSSTQHLRAGASIPEARTHSVVDIGELFNRLGPILRAIDPSKVNEFTQALAGALGGNETLLSDAVHDLSLVAQTLGERDQQVGHLVGDVSTLTGVLADRDREIRTILDNLTTLATTFNANSSLLVATASDAGAFTQRLGALLSRNQAGLDNTLATVSQVLGVVDQRLPALDSIVANLGRTALSLYDAGRYGTWLNQVIPCGAIQTPTQTVPVEATCSTVHPLSPVVPPSHTTGAAAVDQILGSMLGSMS